MLLQGGEVFTSSLINKTTGAVFVVVGREWGSFNPYHVDFVGDEVMSVLRRVEMKIAFYRPLYGWLTHGDKVVPCGTPCYSVDLQTGKPFLIRYLQSIRGIESGKAYLELGAVILWQLLDEGLQEDNIEIGTECTSCQSDRFYSYRNRTAIEKETKPNNGAIAVLVP